MSVTMEPFPLLWFGSKDRWVIIRNLSWDNSLWFVVWQWLQFLCSLASLRFLCWLPWKCGSMHPMAKSAFCLMQAAGSGTSQRIGQVSRLNVKPIAWKYDLTLERREGQSTKQNHGFFVIKDMKWTSNFPWGSPRALWLRWGWGWEWGC